MRGDTLDARMPMRRWQLEAADEKWKYDEKTNTWTRAPDGQGGPKQGHVDAKGVRARFFGPSTLVIAGRRHGDISDRRNRAVRVLRTDGVVDTLFKAAPTRRAPHITTGGGDGSDGFAAERHRARRGGHERDDDGAADEELHRGFPAVREREVNAARGAAERMATEVSSAVLTTEHQAVISSSAGRPASQVEVAAAPAARFVARCSSHPPPLCRLTDFFAAPSGARPRPAAHFARRSSH